MKNIFTTSLLLLLALQSYGQVQLMTEPFFPTADDEVTIYFDTFNAQKKASSSIKQVSVKTGVITDTSDAQEDWKYIVTDWKNGKSKCLMTPQVDGKFTLSFNVRAFYGIPMAEKIASLAFEFFDQDGKIIHSKSGASSFYIPIYSSNLSLQSRILFPEKDLNLQLGESVDVFGIASEEAELSIYDNGVLLTSECGTSVEYRLEALIGNHLVALVTENENSKSIAYFSYFVEEIDKDRTKENEIDYETSITSSDEVNLLLEKSKAELNFDISPNPSAGDISIYYQTNSKNPIQINIIDVTGKQLYEEAITSFPGIHSKSLEMDLPTGIYLVQLKLNDKISTKKLIIN